MKIDENESRQLISTICDQYMVSITDMGGNIIEVNDAFCGISQYQYDELIGQNHRIVRSKKHGPDFFCAMWQKIVRGESWHGEICNRSKDGELYWVEGVISPLKNADGAIDRSVFICRDVTARKTQEQLLIKSESLLDQTGRIAGVGGWEVDLETNHIYWSAETCKIHGVEPGYQPKMEEAIEFYAPEARPIISQAVEYGIESGEGWDLELPFIRATGEKIWVRAVGSVVFDEQKPSRLIGAFQDITERVNQRIEIDEAHDRIALATDSGKIGIWEYDLQDDMLLWDEWMYRLYGLSPSDQREPYELWTQHLHPDDLSLAEKSVQDAIADKAPFDTEFRVIWQDGSIHHIRGSGKIVRDTAGTPLKMIGVNWDVTDIRAITERLSEQHELMQITLESIADAVITTDAEGNTRWLNTVAQRLTGWTNAEAQGLPLEQVFHIVNEDTRLIAENPAETCLKQRKVVGLTNQILLVSKEGKEYGIEESAAPICNERGEAVGVVVVFRDVTQQRRLDEKINYQATHDSLTGLVNRSEFEARLNRLFNQSHQHGSQHVLLYIDLDQFKVVNDTCGHTAGDKALCQLSKLLGHVVGSQDTLARLGGDEFGVLLENCPVEKAKRVGENMCEKMEDFRFLYEGHRFRIGTSIGLVCIDRSWPTIDSLMQAADSACYAAKEAGRNRVQVYSETDTGLQSRHGEMQWASRIENALDKDRFELHAQRIKDLKDDSAGVHLEVLLRMVDTDGDVIPPGAFFPAAERYHLASRIDRWVLKNTIRWLSDQPDEVLSQIDMLCINLSGQSVGDRSFHSFAVNLLSELGEHLCQRICLEITETVAITNFSDAMTFISDVRELGVLVALDDFGAGASSFGYLKSLEVDILKIDGQFIQNLTTDALDAAAVRCFIDVANVVKLKTVAEFVDSQEVLDKINEWGVDYAQGFLIHKPEPLDLLFTNNVPLKEHYGQSLRLQ